MALADAGWRRDVYDCNCTRECARCKGDILPAADGVSRTARREASQRRERPRLKLTWHASKSRRRQAGCRLAGDVRRCSLAHGRWERPSGSSVHYSGRFSRRCVRVEVCIGLAAGGVWKGSGERTKMRRQAACVHNASRRTGGWLLSVGRRRAAACGVRAAAARRRTEERWRRAQDPGRELEHGMLAGAWQPPWRQSALRAQPSGGAVCGARVRTHQRRDPRGEIDGAVAIGSPMGSSAAATTQRWLDGAARPLSFPTRRRALAAAAGRA